MADYDIGAAFAAIENELIASMVRNLDRHRAEEDDMGILWSQWQTEQLHALELYKVRNQKKYGKQFQSINSRIKELIKMAYADGNMEQEIEILEAIKNGFKGYSKFGKGVQGEFFKLNQRKLDALIQATIQDMERAETAILRMANDKYRKVIYNAQVYANTGAGTYEKAVDMATHDMLAAGLNCVEYKNGTRHTLKDYADMAVRTASKRAYLQGEGSKRQEWGISTVIMNKRGNPCPKCLPFVGKILIDDVWSGGSKKDGDYPLMSSAIAAGLFHPRCRDVHTTYFPGISTPPDDTFTKSEIEDIEKQNTLEARKQYAQRQEEKLMRLAKFSLDSENKREYARRARKWNEMVSKRFASHEELDNYIRQMYNGTVDDDVKQLDIKCISQTLSEVERVIDDYPEIKKVFSGLNADDFSGIMAVIPNGELVFNNKRYAVGSKFQVGTGFHEAGHLLELAVIKKMRPQATLEEIMQLYYDGTFTSDVVNKALARIKTRKSVYELKREVSEYATKNDSETIADAVRDYYSNGYAAAALSVQIMKVIGGILK